MKNDVYDVMQPAREGEREREREHEIERWEERRQWKCVTQCEQERRREGKKKEISIESQARKGRKGVTV